MLKEDMAGPGYDESEDSLILFGAVGLTRVDLVSGASAADVYGWGGLRLQRPLVRKKGGQVTEP